MDRVSKKVITESPDGRPTASELLSVLASTTTCGVSGRWIDTQATAEIIREKGEKDGQKGTFVTARIGMDSTVFVPEGDDSEEAEEEVCSHLFSQAQGSKARLFDGQEG